MSPANLAVALLAGLFFIVSWHRLAELQHLTRLRRAAAAMGWRYHAHAEALLRQGIGSLPLFRQGRGRARNVVSDGRLALFDYTWTSDPAAANPASAAQVVAALRAPGVPPFRLEFRRPGEFGMASGAFGVAEELAYTGDPAFDEHYRLFVREQAELAAVLPERVSDFFAAHHGWCVEADGQWLAAYRVGTELQPATLRAQVEEMQRVVGMFV